MRFFLLPVIVLALSACGSRSKDGSSTVQALDTEFGEYTPTTVSSYFDRTLAATKPNAAGEAKDVALVYYAVDTEEPFHQAAVDYEIRSLRAACVSGAKHVNWIAFVNSWINYGDHSYMRCVAGALTKVTLNADFFKLVDQLSSPDYDNSNPTLGLRIKLQHKREFNKSFKSYPLAHPEVLWSLLDKVASTVFPASKYSIVLHLKSHGSNELLLAGLTDAQRDEKIARQKTVLTTYLQKMRDAARTSSDSVDKRNRVACEAVGGLWKDTACLCPDSGVYINQFYGQCTRKLGQVGLGAAHLDELGFDQIGLGAAGVDVSGLINIVGPSVMGANGMGANGMGANGMGANGMGANGMGANGMGANGMGANGMGANGMGANGMGANGMGANGMGANGMGANGMGANGMGANGLGFDDVADHGFGLYAESHFGTTDDAMLQVMTAAKNKGMNFAFVTFESCSSDYQDKPEVRKKIDALGNIDGYYSAKGSLWYRNFDWYTIFNLTNGIEGVERVAKFEKVLDAVTKKIQNYVKVPAGK